MPKKEPKRQCIACREQKEKHELIRIIRTPEGDIIPDDTGRKNGRGAYICKNKFCLQKAIKIKAIDRALNVAVSPEVIALLTEASEGWQ